MKNILKTSCAGVLAAALSLTACNKSGEAGGGKKTVITNIGSDTMVNLAIAWAEAYGKVDPTVSVEVNGGGSGTGTAALIQGTCDIANCSRTFEEKELAELKAKRNVDPKEFMVGYDALSIFVHKDNPLNEISLEQLGDIYREDGKITKWSQLGVTMPGGPKSDEIVRVSRQNNSGTYHYFKEAMIGKKSEYQAGHARHEWKQRCGGAYREDAWFDRLLRHGLRDARREAAQRLQTDRRDRGDSFDQNDAR